MSLYAVLSTKEVFVIQPCSGTSIEIDYHEGVSLVYEGMTPLSTMGVIVYLDTIDFKLRLVLYNRTGTEVTIPVGVRVAKLRIDSYTPIPSPLSETVKVLLDHPSAVLPTKGTPGSAGYDLCSIEEGTVEPGTRRLFKTGLKFEIPDGYMVKIESRSSLALKFSVDVKAGVVDSDYRGDVRVLLRNTGTEPFKVGVGDKIAQMLILQLPKVDLVSTESLSETVRGEGGFGSTE